jgi:hypothetical protein
VGGQLSLISAIEIFDSRCWPVTPADGMSTSQPFTALEQFELAVQALSRAPTIPMGANAIVVSRWWPTGAWAGYRRVPGRRVSWVLVLGSGRWCEHVRPTRVAPSEVSAARVSTGNETLKTPECFDRQTLNH